MKLRVCRKDPELLYETPLIHQSSFWSRVKRRQGFSPMAFDISVRQQDFSGIISSAWIQDDVLVLLHPVSRENTIGYVPYGPLLNPAEGREGEFLEELSEQLRPQLPEHCALLRYDLPWENPWEGDEPGPEIQELRLNWGTAKRALTKSASNQLPTSTLLVDLRPDFDSILSSMKPKTRYNIGLAERNGVSVRQGSIRDLPVFYKLYRETAERNCIKCHSIEQFSSLFAAPDENTGFMLLIAEKDDCPLSAMFLTICGDVATYLYGASSGLNRSSMSTYALQWTAIIEAKKRGCLYYDMFGIAPDNGKSHPMQGLNRFKKGFGGSALHRMGCWDYPLNKPVAEGFFASELTADGYHRS